jgi:hypothetical protein
LSIKPAYFGLVLKSKLLFISNLYSAQCFNPGTGIEETRNTKRQCVRRRMFANHYPKQMLRVQNPASRPMSPIDQLELEKPCFNLYTLFDWMFFIGGPEKVENSTLPRQPTLP